MSFNAGQVFDAGTRLHRGGVSETIGGEFGTTTNRSDYVWPVPSPEKHRIIDWDRYEYKRPRRRSLGERVAKNLPPPPFRNFDTLIAVPDSEKLRFDFNFRPKVDDGGGPRPSQKVIEYEKEKAEAKHTSMRSRPRVFKCPQISLDDVSIDRRDTVCTFVYSTSKTMADITSGVPGSGGLVPAIERGSPSKPFGEMSELRPQSLHEVINPSKNWRHVSIEWDESQRRIFGGRIID